MKQKRFLIPGTDVVTQPIPKPAELKPAENPVTLMQTCKDCKYLDVTESMDILPPKSFKTVKVFPCRRLPGIVWKQLQEWCGMFQPQKGA